MKFKTVLAGGLAGALTLNLLHETYRQIDKDAPKIHLIGEEALLKILKSANLPLPKNRDELYKWTLAGDIISNTAFYSLIAAGKPKNLLKRALILSMAAGVAGVFAPKKMGLNNAPTDRTLETKVLTVLWYTLGGLAAAGVMKAFKR